MIIIKNLTKNILAEPLFEEASFVLNKGDKVGLVGPNGSGKSTLLKIILGEIDADDGEVKLDRERIGYLPQELVFKENETIESFFSDSKSRKSETVLNKVGLGKTPTSLAITNLSGGEKARLSLAKILLQNPTLLLLDEPTNHLDLKGLEWLEGFIRDFKGGVLIVSHDRRLLDNSIHKILEIDAVNHKFVEYIGGYTQYMIEKEKRLDRWEDQYKRQQKEKKRMELWITLKKQEASVYDDPKKGKQIKAMKRRMQREIYDNAILRPTSHKELGNLDIKGKTANSKLIIRVTKISKNFSGKFVLWDASFELRGREHVLLAGENGSGKTTLLKIIIGDMSPDGGEIKLGENVRFGYFSQEHETLDLDKTVMEEFLSTDRLIDSSNPRPILASFLFTGQSVFKKVSSLSIGERVRLIFAKLINQENELLVLDEPINHLDISSREVIEEALLSYRGAILVVSHDRYFIDKISINRSLTIQNGVIQETLV